MISNAHDKYQSSFELNDETYDSLKIIFQELYPDIHTKLETIRLELQNKVDKQISLSK